MMRSATCRSARRFAFPAAHGTSVAQQLRWCASTPSPPERTRAPPPPPRSGGGYSQFALRRGSPGPASEDGSAAAGARGPPPPPPLGGGDARWRSTDASESPERSQPRATASRTRVASMLEGIDGFTGDKDPKGRLRFAEGREMPTLRDFQQHQQQRSAGAGAGIAGGAEESVRRGPAPPATFASGATAKDAAGFGDDAGAAASRPRRSVPVSMLREAAAEDRAFAAALAQREGGAKTANAAPNAGGEVGGAFPPSPAGASRSPEVDEALGVNAPPSSRTPPQVPRSKGDWADENQRLGKYEFFEEHSESGGFDVASKSKQFQTMFYHGGEDAKGLDWFRHGGIRDMLLRSKGYAAPPGDMGGMGELRPGLIARLPSRSTLHRLFADFDYGDRKGTTHVLSCYPWGDVGFVLISSFFVYALYQYQIRNSMMAFYDEYFGIDLRVVPQIERGFLFLVAVGIMRWFLMQPCQLFVIGTTRSWRIFRGRPLGPP